MAPARAAAASRPLWRGGACIFVIASCATLFLLWRRWSHAWGFRIFGLPELRRELNLFSENAFYYSFYRQVIGAMSLSDAVESLRRDHRTEHPRVIDALARFNVTPELLLGAAFRWLPEGLKATCGGAFGFYAGSMLLCNALGSGALCTLSWYVSGGEFACAVATLGMWIAMLVVPASRTIGVHVAALRENFALPLLHMQTLLLAVMLREAARRPRGGFAWWPGAAYLFAFAVASTQLLFVWQFSGFVLCVQVAAAFAVLLLDHGVEVWELLLRLLVGYFAAVFCQGFAMPGGSAAELSPLPEVLAAVGLAVLASPGSKLARGAFMGSVSALGPCRSFITGAFSLCLFAVFRLAKRSLGLVPLSAHVDEMLALKLRTGVARALNLVGTAAAAIAGPRAAGHLEEWRGRLERNSQNATFDSAIYLEADEFRAVWDEGVLSNQVFNRWETKLALGASLAGALAAGLLAAAAVLSHCYRTRAAVAAARAKRAVDSDECAVPACCEDQVLVRGPESAPDVLFVVVLCGFNTVLMALVWRLRVLALPMVAVLAAQAASPRLWSHACPCCRRVGERHACAWFFWLFKWASGLAGLSLSLCYLGILHQFYDTGLNPDTELEDRHAQFKMFTWIQTHAGDAVIAGDPKTLASARLGLPRAAIVAHPHYEDPEARKRFKRMKELLYACAPAQAVHSYATRTNVTHLLLDMAGLSPTEVLHLSPFYKTKHRCRKDFDLLGMHRTFFQIIFGGHRLFAPLHVVGSYVFVEVLGRASASGANAATVGGSADNPESWRALLDRCRGGRGRSAVAESSESCAENLGFLMRALAYPLRQQGWVRALAADAQRRYRKSSHLQAIIARILDYDLSDFAGAAQLYRSAARLAPNEPEHLMNLGSMLAQVYGKKSSEELTEIIEKLAPLLLGSPPGPGPRDLAAQRLCQAAVWSRSLGLASRWEAPFWAMAKLRGRWGCLHDEWGRMEGGAGRSWFANAWDYLRFAD